MSNGLKETLCTHCVHRTVCKHKDDFLKAIQAINEATVHEHEDGSNAVRMTKVINIDCISDISVTCRYHQLEVVAPKVRTT